MNLPIEAQSLSSLTYVLANPPQYPRNPTHDTLRPLVLYIIRVPGSKDVFLTPLKPPTKSSIGLELIQSSLYYLHVNTTEDEQLRGPIESRVDAVHAGQPASTLHRKPLPPLPSIPQHGPYQRIDIGHEASSQETGYNHLQESESLTERDDTAASMSAGLRPQQSISRKPVGSHAGEKRRSQGGLGNTSANHDRDTQEWNSEYRSQSNFWRETVPPAQSQHFAATNNRQDEIRKPDFHSEPTHQSATYSTTAAINTDRREPIPQITLIRRDPVSGAQWNIGSIDQMEDNTEFSILKSTMIKIEMPGYGTFARKSELPRTVTGLSDAHSIKQALASGDFDAASIKSHIGDPTTFTRTVEFRQQPSTAQNSRLHRRTSSYDSVPNYPIQDKPPRSVYSFTSPWQGLCTFSNGIDGKSLKCRHTLPSPNMPNSEGVTVNVAELRFNLAWSVLSPRDPNKSSTNGSDDVNPSTTTPIAALLKDPKNTKQAWRRSVQHIKTVSRDIKAQVDRDRRDRVAIESAYAANTGNTKPYNTNHERSQSENTRFTPISDRDATDRLSLKLGREKGGGGFQGNSAKLGKLIIEDEGLKMGDLVVAACMSVWWQHYAGSIGL